MLLRVPPQSAPSLRTHGLPLPCPLRRFDPLWNSLVVAGYYGGKPFLGSVGMIGTNFTDAHVATGEGCDPVLCDAVGRVGQSEIVMRCGLGLSWNRTHCRAPAHTVVSLRDKRMGWGMLAENVAGTAGLCTRQSTVVPTTTALVRSRMLGGVRSPLVARALAEYYTPASTDPSIRPPVCSPVAAYLPPTEPTPQGLATCWRGR